jgi:hypothetical protein
MSVVLLLVVVLAGVGVSVLVAHQGLVTALRPVDEALAELRGHLVRRHVLAADLVVAVAPRDDAERAAADALGDACARAASMQEVADRAAAEREVGARLDELGALVARRPDFAGDGEIQRLQYAIASLEGDIQVSRAIYDAKAAAYTTRCQLYPSRYVAASFAFPQRPPFGLPERRLLGSPDEGV